MVPEQITEPKWLSHPSQAVAVKRDFMAISKHATENIQL
jgi:hypothetical protein